MSKLIGVIAEDDTDIEVIKLIIGKYIPRNDFKIKKFVGNGCGKLRNKCSVWAQNLFAVGCDHVFVFHDLDRHTENDLRKLLERKVPIKEFPNSLIVIPVEEIEAWLLADSIAIKQVFSIKEDIKPIKDCEKINAPKEELGRIVWRLVKKRYVNSIHNAKLADKVSLDSLRKCKSYIPFDNYVLSNLL